MPEPQGVISMDDILYDEEGTKQRATFVERSCSDRRPSTSPETFRDIRPRPVTCEEQVDLAGGQLVARRPPGVRVRYKTLLHLESQHRVDLDFGYLITSACQILESELSEFVVSPAASFANHLIQIMRSAGKARQAAILGPWAEGRPPTIGIASLVFMALRYGLRANDETCRQFIATHFRPHYLELAAHSQMSASLDRVREKFRNPSCHGHGLFDRDAYYEFSRLLVARRRFSDWLSTGPQPRPPSAAEGLLHWHLVESLLANASRGHTNVPDPLERLLDLGKPRQSRVSVRLFPQHAKKAPKKMDADGASFRLARPFRLGDEIAFQIEAAQDCEVALIDIGTSGNPVVVLPNTWQSCVTVRAGEICRVPPVGGGQYELVLTPPAGRERIVALAWLEEPAVSLRPDVGDTFRRLTPSEVLSLCEAMAAIGPHRWAACTCDFEVMSQ